MNGNKNSFGLLTTATSVSTPSPAPASQGPFQLDFFNYQPNIKNFILAILKYCMPGIPRRLS